MNRRHWTITAVPPSAFTRLYRVLLEGSEPFYVESEEQAKRFVLEQEDFAAATEARQGTRTVYLPVCLCSECLKKLSAADILPRFEDD